MRSLILTSLVGKAVAKATRLRGGHGSALPGLIVEKINPNFLARLLGELPLGVVVVSGTNGKTTTTKMVVELLRSSGLKVFTNPSGSNFTRGVASSALVDMRKGKLDADIAVLELDEAHAVHFVNAVQPRFSLILNVLRDQLDRFGEIDATSKMLAKVTAKTTKTVILNREDPLVSGLSANKKIYFGYSDKVSQLFPNDDEMYFKAKQKENKKSLASIVLDEVNGQTATYNIGRVNLQLRGAHNAFNAAAALALVKEILGEKFNSKKILESLAQVQPAFGRGESFVINDRPLELILVKNPSGFRISLASQNNPRATTMIAINDQYADGRDMSWLWDVDFSSLKQVASVSGIRAYDMALRLRYQSIGIGYVNTNLALVIDKFINTKSNEPMQIFATYTAMLEIRKIIKKYPKVGINS